MGYDVRTAACAGELRDDLQDPERVFTGYTKEGLSYAFTGWSPKGVIVIVVSRAGRIRTMFPAKRFDLWLGRRVNYVEVTDRVR